MNYHGRIEDGPTSRILVTIKSGEDYPYGDIVHLSFQKERSMISDGYMPITSFETIKMNLKRFEILALIELLKKAADEALVNSVIEE